MGRKINEESNIDRGRTPLLGIGILQGWKRPLDLALVFGGAVLWVPLAGLCALWLTLISRGPVIYRQERVGLGGRRFTLYKFRSMVQGADTGAHDAHTDRVFDGGPMSKLDAGDERLIFGGRILRASGLDELPQLLNVLRGEMSLVGPRPCTLNEFEKFQPDMKGRFSALPGLTGAWQVGGKNETTFRRMIDLDLFYVRNSSIWLDLQIIARTVPVVIKAVFEARRFARSQRSSQAAVTPSTDTP